MYCSLEDDFRASVVLESCRNLMLFKAGAVLPHHVDTRTECDGDGVAVSVGPEGVLHNYVIFNEFLLQESCGVHWSRCWTRMRATVL